MIYRCLNVCVRFRYCDEWLCSNDKLQPHKFTYTCAHRRLHTATLMTFEPCSSTQFKSFADSYIWKQRTYIKKQRKEKEKQKKKKSSSQNKNTVISLVFSHSKMDICVLLVWFKSTDVPTRTLSDSCRLVPLLCCCFFFSISVLLCFSISLVSHIFPSPVIIIPVLAFHIRQFLFDKWFARNGLFTRIRRQGRTKKK